MQFTKATKAAAKLRLALIGCAGHGKTYTALAVATALGQRVAVLDTERGSASKYADLFPFDVLALDDYAPQTYCAVIRAAEAAAYDVLVIDSLSHAWVGKGGVLEMHDNATKRQRTANSYTAWRDVTPQHNALVDAMLQANLHVVVTLRAKTKYIIETAENGRQAPRKVGLEPVQRDGLEYEFDVVGTLTEENDLIISKTRCPALAGKLLSKPGADFAATLRDWLTDGVAVEPQADASASNGQSVLRALASRAAKAAGNEPVRSAIKEITGGTLADATADHVVEITNALETLIRERGKA